MSCVCEARKSNCFSVGRITSELLHTDQVELRPEQGSGSGGGGDELQGTSNAAEGANRRVRRTNSNGEDIYPTVDCCIRKGCSSQLDRGGGYVLSIAYP